MASKIIFQPFLRKDRRQDYFPAVLRVKMAFGVVPVGSDAARIGLSSICQDSAGFIKLPAMPAIERTD